MLQNQKFRWCFFSDSVQKRLLLSRCGWRIFCYGMIVYVAYIFVWIFLQLVRCTSFLCHLCLWSRWLCRLHCWWDSCCLLFFSTVASVLRCGIVVANKDFLIVVVDDAADADADADADNVTLLQMTDITNKEVDMDNLFCISTLLQILFSMALNPFKVILILIITN